MSEQKPRPDMARVNIHLTRDEKAAVDDWRYANRVPTRAFAVRLLVAQALGRPAPKDLRRGEGDAEP